MDLKFIPKELVFYELEELRLKMNMFLGKNVLRDKLIKELEEIIENA